MIPQHLKNAEYPSTAIIQRSIQSLNGYTCSGPTYGSNRLFKDLTVRKEMTEIKWIIRVR